MDLVALFKDEENIIELAPEQVIFSKGDFGDTMYVVLEGIVSLSLGYEVLDIIEAGDIVGEMALINSGERSATATAKTPCKMVEVSKDKFLAMVREAPNFSLHVMGILVNRLRNMNENLNA